MRTILAVFDIDGTLRRVPDPWLHLHGHLNTAGQGREFYSRWQRGEISYRRMAELDASLWQGVTQDEMLAALVHNPLRRGAAELVGRLKARGAYCLGLSTGLTLFNDITARQVGLDAVISNELGFANGSCTGRILIRVEEDHKLAVLEAWVEGTGLKPEMTLAFGDGPADVPLFGWADVAVAVFPRSPAVAVQGDVTIRREPLDADFSKIAELLEPSTRFQP